MAICSAKAKIPPVINNRYSRRLHFSMLTNIKEINKTHATINNCPDSSPKLKASTSATILSSVPKRLFR